MEGGGWEPKGRGKGGGERVGKPRGGPSGCKLLRAGKGKEHVVFIYGVGGNETQERGLNSWMLFICKKDLGI